MLYSGQFSAAYLQRSDMPHTALMLAAKQGHIECIALLVKHGFDVNRKLPGGNGGTGLHEAALHGKVDAVRYLIQARDSFQGRRWCDNMCFLLVWGGCSEDQRPRPHGTGHCQYVHRPPNCKHNEASVTRSVVNELCRMCILFCVEQMLWHNLQGVG